MSGVAPIASTAALVGTTALAAACAAGPRAAATAAVRPDSVVIVPDSVAWCGFTTPIVVELVADPDEAPLAAGGSGSSHGEGCGWVVVEQARTGDGARVVVETGSPLSLRRDTVLAVRGRRCRTTLARGGAVLAHLGSDPAAASAAPASCR